MGAGGIDSMSVTSHPPSALGWALIAVHLAGAATVAGTVCMVAVFTRSPMAAVAGSLCAIALGAIWVGLRPYAIAITITESALVARTLAGLQRVPWDRLAGAYFWTSPAVAAELGLFAGAFVGTYRLVAGEWVPFTDGVTFVIAGDREGAAYLAVPEAFIVDGRCAVDAICQRAHIDEPTDGHVLPLAHRLRTLWTSRAVAVSAGLEALGVLIFFGFIGMRWLGGITTVPGPDAWALALLAVPASAWACSILVLVSAYSYLAWRAGLSGGRDGAQDHRRCSR